MSPLQLHLLHTLLSEPLKAIKLRRKYANAFDKMFTYIFGPSFGVEIEAHFDLYKNKSKGISFHAEDTKSYFNRINRIERSLHTKYKTRTYFEGFDRQTGEYAIPVRPQNLHIVYNFFNKLNCLLAAPLGSAYENTSSMHIHINDNLPKEPKKEVTEGIKNHLSLFSKNELKHSSPDNCESPILRYAVLEHNPISSNDRCSGCFGCKIEQHQIKKIISQFLSKKHIPKDRLREYSLLSYKHVNFFYMLRNGQKSLYQQYEQILDILKLDKMHIWCELFGRYDMKELNDIIQNILYSLFYVMNLNKDENFSKTFFETGIKPNLSYNSIEYRFWTGSSNFKTTLKRAMFCNAIQQYTYYNDSLRLHILMDLLHV